MRTFAQTLRPKSLAVTVYVLFVVVSEALMGLFPARFGTELFVVRMAGIGVFPCCCLILPAVRRFIAVRRARREAGWK